MLSEKLKENTKTNHQLLEKKLIGTIKAIRSKQDYAGLLNLFYSFFGGLELTIDEQLDTLSLPDYAQRRKTTNLAADLIQLGATLPKLATGNALPEIQNNGQALGALYVIEGSSLGGRIISKMISQQLNISEPVGISFFHGYGDQTEKMWQEFKQFIDKPIYDLDHDIIIQSANDTFLQFNNWFDHHQ